MTTDNKTSLRTAQHGDVKLEAALHEASIYGIGATSDYNQRIILEAARARLSHNAHQRTPTGWKLVPEKPTDEMIQAAIMTFVRENGGIEHAPSMTYRAMLAAAPIPPASDNAQQGAWQPIETVPSEGQVLVTDWEPGDPWACTIELINLPFLEDGSVWNQNSANKTRPGVWQWWMPCPAAPIPPVCKHGLDRHLCGQCSTELEIK